MSDIGSDIGARVLARVRAAFPVTESPYCDIGIEIGASEVDVLDAVVGMREEGEIVRIGADFTDLEGFVEGASEDDGDLARTAAGDLPWSEHPYEEVAAQMQMRGIDRDAEWVMARLIRWLEDGTITRVAAETPGA